MSDLVAESLRSRSCNLIDDDELCVSCKCDDKGGISSNGDSDPNSSSDESSTPLTHP